MRRRAVFFEPISALIGLTSLISSIIGGSSIAFFGATITAASIGGAIVSGAIAIGLSLAAAAFAPRGSASPGQQQTFQVNTPEIRYSERQAVPSKRIIFGEAQVGGALFFEETQTPYLTMGFLICADEINAFKRCWIGEQEIAFTGGFTENTVLTPIDIDGQPDYPGNLRACFRTGSDSQLIDALIDQDYTNLPSTFRQRGTATAVFRFNFGANQDAFTALWGQVQRPNPLMLVEGVKVYDPRDPLQSQDDASTWAYSNNASLVQTHYLRADFGGRIPVDRIDYDEIAISADWDDTLVGCLDGTFIRRHTVDGVVKLNQAPAEVLRGMLSANRGMVLEQGGRVWVQSSYPQESAFTITDNLLAGGIEFVGSKPKRDDINRLRSRFISSEREYQTVDGPILDRADLQVTDGEVLEATLDLPFTLDHRRAQRLQKAYLETSRLGKRISCRVDVRLLAMAKGRIVGRACTFQSDLFPDANGVYLVANCGFVDNFSALELSLIEYDRDIETDWNADDDEQAFDEADLDVS